MSPPSSSSSPSSAGVRVVVQRYRSCKLLVDGERDAWASVGEEEEEDAKDNSRVDDGSDDSRRQPQEPQLPQARRRRRRHCGLLVYVSFARNAAKTHAERAASTLLNLPVGTRGLWGENDDDNNSPSPSKAGTGTKSVLDLLSEEIMDNDIDKDTDGASTAQAQETAVSSVSIVLVPQANLISKVLYCAIDVSVGPNRFSMWCLVLHIIYFFSPDTGHIFPRSFISVVVWGEKRSSRAANRYSTTAKSTSRRGSSCTGTL